jgi:hypothetical protein
MTKEADQVARGAMSGPSAYGAYLQPPRLCGVDLPTSNKPDGDQIAIEAARSNGTRVHWRTTIEDVAIALP